MMNKLSELTPRRLEIISLIAEGHSLAEIGTQLGITEGTVKNTLQTVRDQTGCKTSAQLAYHYGRLVEAKAHDTPGVVG